MKFLFHGAGTAAVGCAELLVEKMYCEGLSKEKARERIFLVKTDGLIIKKRQTLSEQQIPFAKDGPDLKDLYEIVKVIFIKRILFEFKIFCRLKNNLKIFSFKIIN